MEKNVADICRGIDELGKLLEPYLNGERTMPIEQLRKLLEDLKEMKRLLAKLTDED